MQKTVKSYLQFVLLLVALAVVPLIAFAQDAVIVESETSALADELFPEVEVQNKEVITPEVKEDGFGVELVAGNELALEEAIHSDLVVFGRSLTVDHEHPEDIFAFTQTTTVNQPVTGSLRLFSRTVTIDAPVEGDLFVMADTLTLTQDGTIMGDLTFYGDALTLDGTVAGTTDITAEEATVNGHLVDQARFSVGAITVLENATLDAPTQVRSHDEPILYRDADGLSNIALEEAAGSQTILRTIGAIGAAIVLLGLLGTLASTLSAERLQRIVNSMREGKGMVIERGLLFAVLPPLAAVLLTLTIIGIPVALVLLFFYALGLLAGIVAAAFAIGEYIMSFGKKDKRGSRTGQLWVGLIALGIFAFIPGLNITVLALASIWGAGGITHHMLSFGTGKK